MTHSSDKTVSEIVSEFQQITPPYCVDDLSYEMNCYYNLAILRMCV